MKTPDELIDKFWKGVPEKERVYSSVLIAEVARAYAREACREQREICANDYYKQARADYEIKHTLKMQEAIKNAPEPKMI